MNRNSRLSGTTSERFAHDERAGEEPAEQASYFLADHLQQHQRGFPPHLFHGLLKDRQGGMRILHQIQSGGTDDAHLLGDDR